MVRKVFNLIFGCQMPSCLSYRRLHWRKKKKREGEEWKSHFSLIKPWLYFSLLAMLKLFLRTRNKTQKNKQSPLKNPHQGFDVCLNSLQHLKMQINLRKVLVRTDLQHSVNLFWTVTVCHHKNYNHCSRREKC